MSRMSSRAPVGQARTSTVVGLAAALLAVAGCGDDGLVTPVEIQPGPPVALAMLDAQGTAYRSPVEFVVMLPQRFSARAVLIDSAGRAIGQPVTVRWESSDSTVVGIGASTTVGTELRGLRIGEAAVTASYVVGSDTLRLTNLWHIQQ